MSEISRWILSVAGIVLIGILMEVIIPEGKLSNLLKSVIGIFSVLIIILPFKNIDLTTLDFSKLFNKIVIDEQFVTDREKEKLVSIEKDIENNLFLNGYKGIIVKIDGKFNSDNLQINNVFVDLTNMVLDDENLNINKYTKIMAIIKGSLDIKEEVVIFYE